jgi:hypothetical protein
MELATFEKDYWQLRDGEEANSKNPDTFWIPPLEKRASLIVGDAAKIVLEIECEKEDGEIIVECERGYVIVSKVIDDMYIGILDFQPLCIDKDQEDNYLGFGVEIPFTSKHVIDIDRPPDDYIKWQLGQEPEKIWYRI